MAVHEFKPRGKRMKRTGWTHYIPDLRGIENLAVEHGGLIMQIVIDRDNKRHPNGKRYMSDFGISRPKLNAVLKALGLAIHKRGSSQSMWVDLHGNYTELAIGNATFFAGPNRKRTENEPKTNRRIEALQGLEDQNSSENEPKTNRKRTEDGFIPTVSPKERKNKRAPVVPLTAGDEFDSLAKAREFAQVYPKGNWNGSPRKWTDGLLKRCAKKLDNPKFDGRDCWDDFMAATRAYAVEASSHERGKTLCPDNFIGKDWPHDHFRPQPDRPWNTWRESLEICLGGPDKRNQEHDEGCNGSGIVVQDGKSIKPCKCGGVR